MMLITVQLYNYACIQLLTAQVTKEIMDEQSSTGRGRKRQLKIAITQYGNFTSENAPSLCEA